MDTSPPSSDQGWLALAWFGGFSIAVLNRLWNITDGDGVAALTCDSTTLQRCGALEKSTRRFAQWKNTATAKTMHAECAKNGIRFITKTNQEYPELLRHIHHPPIGLFLRGAPLDTRTPRIAAVGTRAMTPYGRLATHALLQEPAEHGVILLSGLALGVDGAVHETALAAHSKTWAILPGGLDNAHIYPRNHLALAQRILEKNGTLVSEHPPGTSCSPGSFPIRNRIIAGLSQALLVIESTEVSGSIITARLALDENRDVLAVPGPINSPTSAGTNTLIKNGAHVCTSSADIFDALQIKRASTQPTSAPLSLTRQHILTAIPHFPDTDTLSRELQLSLPVLNTELSLLELEGLISRTQSGLFQLTDRSCQIVKTMIISARSQ